MIDRVRWAEDKLQYTFSDAALLKRALTHRSASRRNNERLEFLGDALLNFCVAAELFRRRSGADEGDLSRARAALVNKSTLAEIGRKLEIDTQIILGSGELRSGGAHRSSALADAVEALIGAVLLDGGHDAAQRLVSALLEDYYVDLPDADSLKDPKTRLQEWLQGRGYDLPVYTVESVTGRDHSRRFAVACDVPVCDKRVTGHGTSRRGAEQDAAAQMLEQLNDS